MGGFPVTAGRGLCAAPAPDGNGGFPDTAGGGGELTSVTDDRARGGIGGLPETAGEGAGGFPDTAGAGPVRPPTGSAAASAACCRARLGDIGGIEGGDRGDVGAELDGIGGLPTTAGAGPGAFASLRLIGSGWSP